MSKEGKVDITKWMKIVDEEINVKSDRALVITIGSILDTQLESLLNFSNFLTIKVDNNTGENLEYWSSATWQTALYNFKTKRFKCDFIGYSEVTGRVNEIYFSELEE